MTESPFSDKIDRLAAFFRTFELRVLAESSEIPPGAASLVIEADEERAQRVALRPHGGHRGVDDPSRSFTIAFQFGGNDNPLLMALPEKIDVDLATEPALAAVVGALICELRDHRCGRQISLDRLSEVVVLMMLRRAIDQGASRPGLLAGLSHPALRRVLVAIHDHPGRIWRIDDLVAVSGQSRSRFMTMFPQIVGMTPASYLTEWRLVAAARELMRGATVKAVARQVGFGSAEAFSRAFARRFGRPPSRIAPHVSPPRGMKRAQTVRPASAGHCDPTEP